MQEQLVGMEASLLDDKFITVILRSLLKSYRSLINTISLSATLAKVKLKPDTVMQSLFDKYERLKIEKQQLKSVENTLLARNSSTSKKTDIECWKCGKKGHVKADCHQKDKKKDGEKDNAANIAAKSDNWAFATIFAGQTQCETSPHKETEVDIYDSATSTHMSPNYHCFITFKDIPPCPIAAANKAIINATGIGDICIAIPNNKTTSYVTLKDIMYCKDLAFTLISLA